MNISNIPHIKHTGLGHFLLIAGPCAIEGEGMAMQIAEEIGVLSEKLKIPFVFKGSVKKANRSRLDSFTGIGDKKALQILRKIQNEFKIPTTTDIHKETDAAMSAEYVDILQIPAFLSRQTELLVAAAKTGKAINIKKGQFMSPSAMKYAVNKVTETGNKQVLITERGNMYGYQDMIVDFRGIPEMQQYAPTLLDITHSLQQPNQSNGITGGKPELIETLARAGIAVGIDGIFLETHFDPAMAKSDGANMLKLDRLERLLSNLVTLKRAVNNLQQFRI